LMSCRLECMQALSHSHRHRHTDRQIYTADSALAGGFFHGVVLAVPPHTEIADLGPDETVLGILRV
jgi:hypothetical protein